MDTVEQGTVDSTSIIYDDVSEYDPLELPQVETTAENALVDFHVFGSSPREHIIKKIDQPVSEHLLSAITLKDSFNKGKNLQKRQGRRRRRSEKRIQRRKEWLSKVILDKRAKSKSNLMALVPVKGLENSNSDATTNEGCSMMHNSEKEDVVHETTSTSNPSSVPQAVQKSGSEISPLESRTNCDSSTIPISEKEDVVNETTAMINPSLVPLAVQQTSELLFFFPEYFDTSLLPTDEELPGNKTQSLTAEPSSDPLSLENSEEPSKVASPVPKRRIQPIATFPGKRPRREFLELQKNLRTRKRKSGAQTTSKGSVDHRTEDEEEDEWIFDPESRQELQEICDIHGRIQIRFREGKMMVSAKTASGDFWIPYDWIKTRVTGKIQKAKLTRLYNNYLKNQAAKTKNVK